MLLRYVSKIILKGLLKGLDERFNRLIILTVHYNTALNYFGLSFHQEGLFEGTAMQPAPLKIQDDQVVSLFLSLSELTFSYSNK